MNATDDEIIHVYPTELHLVGKFNLPAGKHFTEGSLSALLEETAARWKKLYQREPAFRLSQLKPTKDEPFARTQVRIWSQDQELPKPDDELIWLHQEIERRYGGQGGRIVTIKPLPRATEDPYTLMLTLNPREAGRLKARHRSQFIMLPGGYTGFVWHSLYLDGGVFTERETGERVFVQYWSHEDDLWPVRAGSIYPIAKHSRRSEQPARLKAIGRIRLFERSLVSYQPD